MQRLYFGGMAYLRMLVAWWYRLSTSDFVQETVVAYFVLALGLQVL